MRVMVGCKMCVGLQRCFRIAEVSRWLIIAVCDMIRILACGFVDGRQCGNGVRVRSVRLGRLTCLLFAMAAKLQTYDDCKYCSEIIERS